MRLAVTIATVVALSAAVASIAVLASPQLRDTAGLTSGHMPLHIGCPAGSHGKPRFFGVGEKLEAARSAARSAPRSIERRAFTARE